MRSSAHAAGTSSRCAQTPRRVWAMSRNVGRPAPLALAEAANARFGSKRIDSSRDRSPSSGVDGNLERGSSPATSRGTAGRASAGWLRTPPKGWALPSASRAACRRVGPPNGAVGTRRSDYQAPASVFPRASASWGPASSRSRSSCALRSDPYLGRPSARAGPPGRTGAEGRRGAYPRGR
jgi:hypothetical protein